MTNSQIYRKVLSFSLVGFLVDLLVIGVLIGTSAAGFYLGGEDPNKALIGLVIGFFVGIIFVILINVFLTNRIKAAQIAMITVGVTQGAMPENVFHAGFEEIKGRFGTITAYYFVTQAIRGIFQQLGQAITKLGKTVGGDVGEGIGSAIDSAVQTLIGYLCDCCLGWVIYRKGTEPARAACEGAAIFFKNGKSLLKNVGRIFGIGAVSLVLAGGTFFGGLYLLFSQMPAAFSDLATTIVNLYAESEEAAPEFLTDPSTLLIACAAFVALLVWMNFHNVLIRPFILVGVMRNFMEAGRKRIPGESDFRELDNISPRFARLRKKA